MAAHGIGMMFSTVVSAGGKPVNLAGEVCGNGGGGRHGGHHGCFAGRGVDWKLAGALGCGYGLVGQQHYGHALLRPVERWRLPTAAVGLQQQPSTSPALEAAKELDDELSRRALDLDPRGYFVIRVDRQGGDIVAEFFRNIINSAGLACDPDTGKVIPCDGSYRPRPYSIFRVPNHGFHRRAVQPPGGTLRHRAMVPTGHQAPAPDIIEKDESPDPPGLLSDVIGSSPSIEFQRELQREDGQGDKRADHRGPGKGKAACGEHAVSR